MQALASAAGHRRHSTTAIALAGDDTLHRGSRLCSLNMPDVSVMATRGCSDADWAVCRLIRSH